jgi:hypothetical protein
MEEANHACKSTSRLLINKPETFNSGSLNLAGDIVGFKTQMVQPLATLLQKTGHTGSRGDGFKQFNLTLPNGQQSCLDPLILDDIFFVDP